MTEQKDLREELGSLLDAAEEGNGQAAGDTGGAGDSVPTAGDVVDKGAAPQKGEVDAGTEKGDAGGRARGPDGKFVKADVPAAAGSGVTPENKDGKDAPALQAPQEGQQQAQEAPQVGVDLPPSTFTTAAKAAYLALPADNPLKQEIKKREADFQKGIGQYKQAADAGNRLMSVLQPHMASIQAEGSTPERAIQSLLNTAHQLRTADPVTKGRLVMQIAQQYGADLSQFMGQKAASEVQGQQFDPNTLAPLVNQLLQPVLQDVNQFKTQFLSAQQQRETAEAQAANAGIEQFRVAADDKGQPKHPYFDDVRAFMADLLEKGHAPNMDAAYEMACRAHPEVSRVIASEQTQRLEAQRLAEAKRKAEEARRSSSVNAEGQGGVGIAGATSNTLRGELESLYDGSGARL